MQRSFPHLIILSALFLVFMHGSCRADDELIVGREIVRYIGTATEATQLTFVLSVYNTTNRDIEDVLLQDTFPPGVTLQTSNPPASRLGDTHIWALGLLRAQDVLSVTAELDLNGISVGEAIDNGAMAVGGYYLSPVRDSAIPATLPDLVTLAPELTATLDANSQDMYIRRLAARIDYNAGALLDFVQNDVGFELYDGSLRGARGTLWSLAGNALDQSSLLIALLRASKVPARYVDGIISASDAQRLISSMFPERQGVSGTVPDHFPKSDPASNAAFIVEATPHTWVEYYLNNDWHTIDPSFTSAPPSVPAITRYAEIPDSRRHKIRFQLTAESAGSAFGNTILHPMDVTLPIVQTVGEPLTIGHAAKRTVNTFGFYQVTQEYLPYVAVGPHAATGERFKEEWGNSILLFFQNIITAEWLDISIESPDGATQTYRRTLFDKMGVARRANGEEPTFNEFNTNPTQPTISELDFVTVYAPVSRTDPSLAMHVRNLTREHEKHYMQILPLVQDINLEHPAPADLPILKELSALLSESPILTTRALAASFLVRSDFMSRQTAEGFNVLAYPDSPQIIIANSHAEGQDITYRLDLRRTSERVIPDPGQTSFVDFFYRSTKGRLDAGLEESTASAFAQSATQTMISLFTILTAAEQQNIEIKALAQENIQLVDGLSISDEAKIRVKEALNAGKTIEIPASAPVIDGSPAIGWWETDPLTGETYAVLEDGGHQAIIHYVAVINGTALNNWVAAGIGAISGFFIQFYSFTGGFLEGLVTHQNLEEAVKEAKAHVAVHVAQSCAGIIGGAAGAAGGTAGSILGDALVGALPGQTSFSGYLRTAMALALENLILEGTGLRESFLTGMCYGGLMAINWIRDNFGGDPELAPYYMNTRVFDPAPASVADSTTTAQFTTAIQRLTGTVNSEYVHVAGYLYAQFDPVSEIGITLNSLSSANAEVRNGSGQVVSNGAVSLTGESLAGVLESADSVLLAGTGSLTSLPRFLPSLAAGSDWDIYNATATGNATLIINGSPIINNNTMPVGLYSITGDILQFQGAGSATLLSGTGPIELNASQSILGFGAGKGRFQDGFLVVNIDEGIGFAGYNGSLALARLDDASSVITASGTITQSLRLVTTPKILNTANDGAMNFTLSARGKSGEIARLQAVAPDGWGALFTSSNQVSLTPPVQAAQGTYTGRFFVESDSIPGLVGQSRGTVNIQSLSSGIQISAAHQPDRYIIKDAAWIPGVFEITLKGRSPETLALHLSQIGAPSGTVNFSKDVINLVGTSTERAYLYLVPDDPLPASGTVFNLQITADDTTAGVIGSTTVQFTMPSIPGIAMTVDRPNFYTANASKLPVELTVRNTGNISRDVVLSFTDSPGFTQTFTQPGMLSPGEEHKQTVMLEGNVAPPGTTSFIIIQAMSEGIELNRIGLKVEVLDSRAGLAALNAALTARLTYRISLWLALDSLADAILALEQDFQNNTLRDHVIAHISNVRSVLPPGSQSFDPRLDSIATSMSGHEGTSLVPDLNALAIVLDDLTQALIGGPNIAGDLDIDGLVDYRDLFILQKTWQRSPADPARADLFPDGIVDTKDLLEFINSMEGAGH